MGETEGACGSCQSDRYDCVGDFDCEQVGSKAGDSCGPGDIGTCQDACCNTCSYEQPRVPLGNDVDTSEKSVFNFTDPLVHIEQQGDGDFAKFYGPANAVFYMNNQGQIGIESNADSGNFLYFQKNGSEAFKVTHDGRIYPSQLCLLAEEGGEVYSCFDYWPGLEGGPVGGDVWTDVDGFIYSEAAGDYGDTGLRITDTGDLLMNGDLS